jgi:hydroxyacylglutathione hydrolase
MTTFNRSVAILPLHAFNDNYIWVLRRDDHVVVVDPGDAAPVVDYLTASGGKLRAILVTHHHGDHVGGINQLLDLAAKEGAEPAIQVIGPATENIASVTQRVSDNDRILIDPLGLELLVIDVPGHTAGHVAYYGRMLGPDGALFCGDTLFGAGCGRLFEGTPAQMHNSLSRLAKLPPQTLVYCAHEYTQSNMRFALAVEPESAAVQSRMHRVTQARADKLATVPSSMELELATNPFLRSTAPEVIAAARQRLGREPRDAIETFTAIRRWKDEFR